MARWSILWMNFDFNDSGHEGLHGQHTNRYEEVSKRIRLGKAIGGRDEKGIKKTVCAFLKILHPHGPPTDAEFEEYVAYATECSRRVKEQMNKRKPDDELALIGLSYFKSSGEEVVVFCPESKDAAATQQPARRRLRQFARFCETVLKAGTVKKISLITGYDDQAQLAEMTAKLEELEQSLLELDVELEVTLDPNLHDREIRLDNGWIIKIGRGLDLYQKPASWLEVGADDLDLRKCLETKVDIFKAVGG